MLGHCISKYFGLTVCKMCSKIRNSHKFPSYTALICKYIPISPGKPATKTQFHHRLNFKVVNAVKIPRSNVEKNTLPILNCHFLHGKGSLGNETVISKNFSTSNLLNKLECASKAKEKEDITGNKSKKIEDIRESVMTIPNLLTTSRIIATPFLGYLVLNQMYPLACGLFVIAGITDLLDGYIARNYNQKSVFGSALDPLADKFLVSVLTITLTMVNLIPVPLAAVIVGRDIFLIAVGFYLRYISLPPPITFSRYFDITNATVTVLPSSISKINTALQLTLVAASLAAPVFGFVDHWALQTLGFITGTTTVASGIHYIINRNESVQFLQDKMKRKL